MLSILGKIYGLIADLRNALYGRGTLRVHSLGAKSISIGNLTVGGTGKTPITALAAQILAENGRKVCILTRGYGRRNPHARVLVSDGERVLADAETAGDEPLELAEKLLGKAIVIADADRVSAAQWATANYAITAFVLDDGFQHRRAVRHLDLVCVDAAEPFGNGRMLPAGRLREPSHNLARADAIIITGPGSGGDFAGAILKVRDYNPHCPIFTARRVIMGFTEIGTPLTRQSGTSAAGSESRAAFHDAGDSVNPRSRALAFCGLANPEAFFREVEGKVSALHTERFRDHFQYTQKDADRLTARARETASEILITTFKDAVKLRGLTFGLPCFAATMEIAIDDEEAFRKLIITSF